MSNMEELLKALQADYLAGLPAKIATIRGFIDRGDLHEIRDSFHKLKGTGKTYGMPEVSELAALVERVCIDTPAQSVPAGELGLRLLTAVHSARVRKAEHPLADDPHFQSLRRLLTVA